ncbi:MAG: hypothetical protein ACRERE_12140 [Candidatus Entotheonellia bacterium]
MNIGRTIVHEAAHKFTDCRDKAYKHDTNAWNNMTPTDALNNADSYAWALRDLKTKNPRFAHFLRRFKNCGRVSGAKAVPHGRDPDHCQ